MFGLAEFSIEFVDLQTFTVENVMKNHRGGPIRQENGVGRHWIAIGSGTIGNILREKLSRQAGLLSF